MRPISTARSSISPAQGPCRSALVGKASYLAPKGRAAVAPNSSTDSRIASSAGPGFSQSPPLSRSAAFWSFALPRSRCGISAAITRAPSAKVAASSAPIPKPGSSPAARQIASGSAGA